MDFIVTWEAATPVLIGLASVGGFVIAVAKGVLSPDRRRPTMGRPAAGRPAADRRRSATAADQTPSPMRKIAPAALALAVMAGGVGSAAALLLVAAFLPAGVADRALLAALLWPALWAWGIGRLYAALAGVRFFSKQVLPR